MTQLTTSAGQGAVVIRSQPPSEPLLSPNVKAGMAAIIEPIIGRMPGGYEPGMRVQPNPLSSTDWNDAQSAADAYDAMLTPIGPGLILMWLKTVNDGCRNIQGPREFAGRCAAIQELCADLPAAAFTAESRRALQSDGFFPSAFHVRQVIEPIAAGWRRKRDALRVQGKRKPKADTSRVENTPEQLAAMSAKAVAHAAELQAFSRQNCDRTPSVTPRASTLNPKQLIALYDQVASRGGPGSEAAAFRASTLREYFRLQRASPISEKD